MQFRVESKFHPTGDQPKAIAQLTNWLRQGVRHQTLLGVTGSGKTFTMANVIAALQKPALVISHNKTLAAQLYEEFRQFFPDNAVHYFVSYYDYYQPEAYIPQTDTYIEKDAKINATIDALRHASTASILTRRDALIVASVSCIYGVGNPEEYQRASSECRVGEKMSLRDLTRRLVLLQYARNALDPRQGHFRVRENTVEIHLPSGQDIVRVALANGRVQSITKLTRAGSATPEPMDAIRIFPAKHFVTPQDTLELALANIKQELAQQLTALNASGHILEAARLKQRTEFDINTLRSSGYVNGIENYSRHLEFREPGSPPHTLLDYFRHAYQDDFLVFLDESHATVPQMRGMERGDRARKNVLVEYGFRLPSARDNRPLTFDEFHHRVKQIVYASATPGAYELRESEPHVAEQLIRPTGILDPQITIRPTHGQIQDVIREVQQRVARGERSLVMALTKRLAEEIADYLQQAGIRAAYLHADIKTLDRPDVLNKLRAGEHDVIVGINLLREGLDLPEVSFIAILDADKEGFLRNETTLLQIIGRAARHLDGAITLYADTLTGSMRAAIDETRRRRKIQDEYNRAHHITPRQIHKTIRDSLLATQDAQEPARDGPVAAIIKELEREMKKAAGAMDFERAAYLRDQIKKYAPSPNKPNK